jgi:8-oxo-dGTP diphosphatase
MEDPENEYDWDAYAAQESAVLTFVRKAGKILLIRKLRGLGAGKINAPGGRIEHGETPEQAAVRETAEEVGLTVWDLKHMAVLHFAFVDGYTLSVDVFLTERFSGHPIRTEEADPFWVDESEIPFAEMWEDDQLWLPAVLEGSRVVVRGYFDGDRMVSGDMRPLQV